MRAPPMRVEATDAPAARLSRLRGLYGVTPDTGVTAYSAAIDHINLSANGMTRNGF